MNVSGFDDETRTFEVTAGEGQDQTIDAPKLPFSLNVSVQGKPVLVDLTAAYDSADPIYLKLNSSTQVRFLEDAIEVQGKRVRISGYREHAVINIGIILIGIGTKAPCKHGFVPSSSCEDCNPPLISTENILEVGLEMGFDA